MASGFILMTGSVQWVGLTKSHQWFVEWRVRRGEVALARGERDFAGSATLDLEGYREFEILFFLCVFFGEERCKGTRARFG